MRHLRSSRTGVVLAVTTVTMGILASTAATSSAGPRGAGGEREPYTTKTPTSTGFDGAVSSVDPEASRIGIRVLKKGGNAVDAAVATAAALGVTEPYSAGLGGGGYFVYYDARSGKVRTIDGRETAPRSMPQDAFDDPSTGEPYNFFPELVTSGVSVGVPGTPATWQHAVNRWGNHAFKRALWPAARLARRGFIVDETFRQQTEDNQERFEAYTTTPRLFLPGGEPPPVGSVFRIPGLANTYELLAREGPRPFYRGRIAEQMARLVQEPPKSPDTELPVPAGFLTERDLARYDIRRQRPTQSDYRQYDIYGMAPSSSGGSTVGELFNILERYQLAGMAPQDALHLYLEATALAFADRGEYVGDPAYVDVPLRDLLSDRFARERACTINETEAADKPVAPGDVDEYDGRCNRSARSGGRAPETENVETTNLTVADRWGNVVEYTLTIEQTGGSGMLIPGRGFLMNNELTDFSYTEGRRHPNQIRGGKRPRSSMSPTIILRNGRPFLALGSPGGSTIITTVAQLAFNRIDRGMSLPQAMAESRATQQNTPVVVAEPEFVGTYGSGLRAYGHRFSQIDELGAATAIEFGPRGLLTAVAEPERRGGGSALVVRPSP